MMKVHSLLPLGVVAVALFGGGVAAAVAASTADATYLRVANERADKIVATLAIADAAQALRARDIVARQYCDLRDIHDAREAGITAVRDAADLAGSARDERITAIRAEAEAKLFRLHYAFLARLATELTPAQIDQVKDGLTYGVLPGTYKHYLELYPALSAEQRRQILAWLTEAREFAMDAGTSEEKHGWFGKYKGRINNHLSAAGFDAKEAERVWNEKQRARSAEKPKE